MFIRNILLLLYVYLGLSEAQTTLRCGAYNTNSALNDQFTGPPGVSQSIEEGAVALVRGSINFDLSADGTTIRTPQNGDRIISVITSTGKMSGCTLRTDAIAFPKSYTSFGALYPVDAPSGTEPQTFYIMPNGESTWQELYNPTGDTIPFPSTRTNLGIDASIQLNYISTAPCYTCTSPASGCQPAGGQCEATTYSCSTCEYAQRGLWRNREWWSNKGYDLATDCVYNQVSSQCEITHTIGSGGPTACWLDPPNYDVSSFTYDAGDTVQQSCAVSSVQQCTKQEASCSTCEYAQRGLWRNKEWWSNKGYNLATDCVYNQVSSQCEITHTIGSGGTTACWLDPPNYDVSSFTYDAGDTVQQSCVTFTPVSCFTQALSPPPGLPPSNPAIAPSPPSGPQVVNFTQDVPKSFGLIVNNSFNITSFSIPKGTRIETADEKFKFNHIYEELSNDEIEKFDIGIGYTITASQNFNLTFEGPPISDSETLQISLKKGRPTSFSPYTNKNIKNALNIPGMDSDFTVYVSKDGEVCEYTSGNLRSSGSSDNCDYTEFKKEIGYTLLANENFVLQI